MRLRKNWMRLAAAAAATALLATACGGDGDEGDSGNEGDAQASSGGELRTDIREPEHLIPTNTNESEGGTIMDVVYSQMVEYDEEGNLLLTIANSIETEDGIHWSITLNEGWTFHNDEPVNADAFIRGWNYGAYGGNAQGNSYFFDRIVGYDEMQYKPDEIDPETGEPIEGAPEPTTTELAGLEKTGEYSFDVTLTEPFVSFDMMLGYTAFAPMAQACLDDIEACETAPIGNGPFQIDGEWVHNEQIRVTRFDGYQGEKPQLDAITFRIFADDVTAWNEVQAGGIDLIRTVPPEQRGAAETAYGERFLEEPTSSFTYLGFPLYDPKFEDKRIRQAISLAIDRQEIIDAILDGAFVPAKSFVSPTVPGSRDDACDYCELDVERAKDLLAEAGGWPKGEKLKIRFNPGAGHDGWTEAVGNQLRENLGIDYELDSSLEWAQYLETLDAKQADGLFRLGWIMDYPSPENYLKPIYGSQGSSNNAGYANPEFDQLITSGDAAEDLDAAIADYQAAEDFLLEDLPVLPMWYGQSGLAYNDNVDNVTYDLINTNPFWTQITMK